jgi:hypothetical protein
MRAAVPSAATDRALSMMGTKGACSRPSVLDGLVPADHVYRHVALDLSLCVTSCTSAMPPAWGDHPSIPSLLRSSGLFSAGSARASTRAPGHRPAGVRCIWAVTKAVGRLREKDATSRPIGDPGGPARGKALGEPRQCTHSREAGIGPVGRRVSASTRRAGQVIGIVNA